MRVLEITEMSASELKNMFAELNKKIDILIN